MTDVQVNIEKLLFYGEKKGLLSPLDKIICRNHLLELFKLEYDDTVSYNNDLLKVDLMDIVEPLLDYGVSIHLVAENTTTDRDQLESKIMSFMTPSQQALQMMFELYQQKEGIVYATNYFYELSKSTNYIKLHRIAKNLIWYIDSEYGKLEITVNLSKPEKDPKEIALAKNTPSSNYPKCLLCVENIGYAGSCHHPARHNHRVIPITLDGTSWYFQYSPYLYYNEHCIILNEHHVPMTISKNTFVRLFDFVDQMPHYFIGSNADLPIVGGSILSHDHFQGGRHTFAMANAPIERFFKHPKFPSVTFGVVRWPMSVLRLSSLHRNELIAFCDHILTTWRTYSDLTVDLCAFTEDIPHNTITPIARKKSDGTYEIDLVLRNNRTSEKYPDGIFHPHPQLHHIKKENIGLIEVMGLAILPERLADPIRLGELSKEDIGRSFVEVLHDAGIFKRCPEGQKAFDDFISSL